MKKPSPIVFIFLTIFIEFMGGSLLVPLVPYIVGQFQSDGFVIGLLVSSFSLAQFLAAPSLGALSDRFGRRPVLLLSLLGTGVGYLVFGLAHSLVWLFDIECGALRNKTNFEFWSGTVSSSIKISSDFQTSGLLICGDRVVRGCAIWSFRFAL